MSELAGVPIGLDQSAVADQRRRDAGAEGDEDQLRGAGPGAQFPLRQPGRPDVMVDHSSQPGALVEFGAQRNVEPADVGCRPDQSGRRVDDAGHHGAVAETDVGVVVGLGGDLVGEPAHRGLLGVESGRESPDAVQTAVRVHPTDLGQSATEVDGYDVAGHEPDRATKTPSLDRRAGSMPGEICSFGSQMSRYEHIMLLWDVGIIVTRAERLSALLEHLVTNGRIDVDESAGAVRRVRGDHPARPGLSRRSAAADPDPRRRRAQHAPATTCRCATSRRPAARRRRGSPSAPSSMLWPGCTLVAERRHDHGRDRPSHPRRRGPAQRRHRGDQRAQHRHRADRPAVHQDRRLRWGRAAAEL